MAVHDDDEEQLEESEEEMEHQLEEEEEATSGSTPSWLCYTLISETRKHTYVGATSNLPRWRHGWG